MASLDDDVNKMLAMYAETEKSVSSKTATQFDVCTQCRENLQAINELSDCSNPSFLNNTGYKLFPNTYGKPNRCEYCGVQLITTDDPEREGGYIIRRHFNTWNDFWLLAERHTPELCREIRAGGYTVSGPKEMPIMPISDGPFFKVEKGEIQFKECSPLPPSYMKDANEQAQKYVEGILDQYGVEIGTGRTWGDPPF